MYRAGKSKRGGSGGGGGGFTPGAAQRIPFASAVPALTDSTKLTWDDTNGQIVFANGGVVSFVRTNGSIGAAFGMSSGGWFQCYSGGVIIDPSSGGGSAGFDIRMPGLISQPFTRISNANHTITTAEPALLATSLSAARAWTFPASAGLQDGTHFFVAVDSSCSATNTLTISGAGGDTVTDGVFNAPSTGRVFKLDKTAAVWRVVGAS